VENNLTFQSGGCKSSRKEGVKSGFQYLYPLSLSFSPVKTFMGGRRLPDSGENMTVRKKNASVNLRRMP